MTTELAVRITLRAGKENMMAAFLQEEEIQAAYDAAETVLMTELNAKFNVGDFVISTAGIRRIARNVADAVIRTQTFESGDITDLPVAVEYVRMDKNAQSGTATSR